jgi:hypothetical protein
MTQAAKAAANFSPAVIDAAVDNLPTQYQQAAPPAARPSIQNMLDNAGITVDEYVYPDKAGCKISKDMKGYLDDFEAIIDMSEVIAISSFSSELGGNTTFVKSYDGVTAQGGGNYQLELARLSRRAGSKNRGPTDTVEIPMELSVDVKDPKSTLTFDAGTLVGLTPSPTGVKEFNKLLKTLAKIDPNLTVEGRVHVKCVNKERTNTNGNTWGVIAFELIAVLDD